MTPAALAIVHSLQGRLRLRLAATAETAGLVEAIRALPGVTACTWSPRTHGLLVHYLAEEITPAEIVEAVVTHTGMEAPAPVGDLAIRDEPLATTIASAVGSLDARVARATRGRLDLGVLVPLALTAWALRELLRPRVAPLSWSSALWYAHGLFRDYALRERS